MLIEAGGTFDVRAVERRHLARSMSVKEDRSVTVLCVLEWQETETGRSNRERDFGPKEAGA